MVCSRKKFPLASPRYHIKILVDTIWNITSSLKGITFRARISALPRQETSING